MILPLTAAATTVFDESIHRSSSSRLSNPWEGRNFDFGGDFASSDSSYEAFQQPYFDAGGYTHDPSLTPVTPYHEQRGHSPPKDSKSHLKASSAGTVNEFDNLTPYSGEVSGAAFSSDPGAAGSPQDPEARFFIDMCAVKNFFGRKKRSAAPLFFFHYGYNQDILTT